MWTKIVSLIATIVIVPAVHAVCAVDMGSNSFKFTIAEIRDGRYVELIEPRFNQIGVGDDLNRSQQQTGELRISEVKLKEIAQVLEKYVAICQQHGGGPVYAVATAAFRQAKNQNQLLALAREAGVQVEIIDGIREAELSYIASVFDQTGHAVVDFGSRSTEFVTRDADGKFSAYELPTGHRSAFQRHFEKSTTFAAAAASYRSELRELMAQMTDSDRAILLGKKSLQVMEGAKIVSWMQQIPTKDTDGKILSRTEIAAKVAQLSVQSASEYAKLMAVPDIGHILPRLVFLDLLLEITGYDKAAFNTRELNAGLIWERQKR